MVNSDTEMTVRIGPDEEAELDEGDSPSMGDDYNHGSHILNENGNGNVNVNGNGNVNPHGKMIEEESVNKVQNGGNSVEATPARISGRLLARSLPGGRSGSGSKRLKTIEDDEEAGTKEEQVEFMKELQAFCKERYLDFRPPKFYGVPLNLLKLWRAVVKLGGYDRALLEYEKHKIEIGEVEFPDSPTPERASAEIEGGTITSSGRVRRDAATRAMQGWHAQRKSGYVEAGEPIVKDKNPSSSHKREKHLKNIGVKPRKSSNFEHEEDDMLADTDKQLRSEYFLSFVYYDIISSISNRALSVYLGLVNIGLFIPSYSCFSIDLVAFIDRLVATIIDVGPPADWVKINVRECKDCFEVYALIPGLLREEVRVQSDASGRVVITGMPEQLDNPWGITPFKKIVNLPSRIDTLHTSAVVSLHGRLFVRVPFARHTIQ
ncbi:hypothetical protein KSS87_020193 [Heliosperma pusillum]|nr:hypothetical protein KSS87_020193 [Heliosperma pusillum]